MPTLLLTADDRTRAHPLASSTLIGRAPACHLRITDPAVPLYWLEVRWLGDVWGWRTLGAESRTRGAGPADTAGWRRLTASAGRGGRVTLDTRIWVELVDGGPPEPFVVDARTGERLVGDALHGLVECWPDKLLPLDAEGDAARAYVDGDVFVVAGRAYRAHVPDVPEHTVGARMDLRDGSIDLDLDLASRVAVFTQGSAEARVRGECVRVLAVYAEARRRDAPEGGWLRPDEAWEAWRALGAPTDAPLERLGWERTRLRTNLAHLGVAGLEQLFETQREGLTWRLRLSEHVRLA